MVSIAQTLPAQEQFVNTMVITINIVHIAVMIV